MGRNDKQRRNKYTSRANIKCHIFFILFYIITVSYFKVAKFSIIKEKYEIYIIEQILLLIYFIILEIFFVYHICTDEMHTVHSEFYKGKISSILYIYGCCMTYCIAIYLLYFDFTMFKKMYLDICVCSIIFALIFLMELIYMIIILKRRNNLRCRIYCFFRHMMCNLLLYMGILINLILFFKLLY